MADHTLIVDGTRWGLEFDYADDTGATFYARSEHGAEAWGHGHVPDNPPYKTMIADAEEFIADQIRDLML